MSQNFLPWVFRADATQFPVGLAEGVAPGALAYLGDAVFELYVRTYYLFPPKRIGLYHQKVVEQVRAESQALFLQQLTPHLTLAEQEIVRRGRNATARTPRRLAPELYQQATGLETLIGYLYLHDLERLQELLSHLQL